MAYGVSAVHFGCGLWVRDVCVAMTSPLSVGGDRSPSASRATPRKDLLSCFAGSSSLLPPSSPPALSLPSEASLVVGTVFRRPSGTARRSLICRAIGRSFFRPPAYRLRGTRQTSTGKVQQTSWPSRRLYVRITDGNRASLLGASPPDAAAYRRFTFVRVGHAPMTSTRPPLAGSPRTSPPARTWCSRSTPLSLRCRVPSVRAPGLDLHLLSVDHAVRNPKVAPATLLVPPSVGRTFAGRH